MLKFCAEHNVLSSLHLQPKLGICRKASRRALKKRFFQANFMKITDKLKQAKNTLFSVEIIPPALDKNIDDLFNQIRILSDLDPAFIDIPYRQEELAGLSAPDRKQTVAPLQKRAGMVGICSAIKQKFDIDPVAHILCKGFTKDETEDALLDLNFLGIDNVMLLQGDPPKSKFNQSVQNPDQHTYTYQLVNQVQNLNEGIFLQNEWPYATATDFCIGVAGYPEKHQLTPDHQTGLQHLKQKVDAGADYILTQMIYDNQIFFRFVDDCRKAGISIPIIPGLRPLTSASLVTSLPNFFAVSISDDLAKEVAKAKTKEAVQQAGVEWAIMQTKELIKAGLPCIHFFAMHQPQQVRKVVEAAF